MPTARQSCFLDNKQVPQIDYFFSGPALISLKIFVQQHLKNDFSETIEGIFSTECSESDYPAGEEENINSNIIPDYNSWLDKLHKSFPNDEVVPAIPFETSRGCHWGEISLTLQKSA